MLSGTERIMKMKWMKATKAKELRRRKKKRTRTNRMRRKKGRKMSKKKKRKEKEPTQIQQRDTKRTKCPSNVQQHACMTDAGIVQIAQNEGKLSE